MTVENNQRLAKIINSIYNRYVSEKEGYLFIRHFIESIEDENTIDV